MLAPINRLITCTFTALVLVALSSVAAAQQTGAIRGTVINENQQPIADINIGLEGTTKGNASDSQGKFMIRRIPAGNYTIVASGVGFSTERKEISIQPGQLLTVNVQLSKSNRQLQEIVVSAEKINKFSVEESDYVAKVPLENIENPQVYNTISSELITDQVITNFEDVLKNAPGIFKLWESTGRGGDGAGYYSLRGFAVQPTMQNGLPSLTNGSLDPSNIARVEVIKGPSGTLYGSSLISYGGLINVVTKKPYETLGGEFSYKTGSFGLNRVTADVNVPLSKKEDIDLRVNGAYHTQSSFQDAGFHESYYIAPSLSYQANDKLSFLLNTEFYRPESTNPTMLFLNRSAPLTANNMAELDYNPKYSYTSNNLTISNPTFNFQGQMHYQISDAWTSQTAISTSRAKTDGYYTYLWDFAGDQSSSVFTRYLSNQNSTTLGTDIQQNFIGNFSAGGIQNKMVVGVDFFQERVINNSTGYVGLGTVTLGTEPTGISKSAADTALASATVNQSETQQRVYSAYISDVIELLPQLSVMASLRVDHFDTQGIVSTNADDFTQTAYSPKFGIMVKPLPEKLSLFANYMDGFKNIAPITAGNQTFTFTPEHARQWETGIKTNLYNGRLAATLSYYNIRVDNMVRQIAPEEYIQDGENYSRGFEASITASPLPGLNIIGGYSYNESEIVNVGAGHYQEAGRRPEEAGPKTLVNGWASYQISGGSLEGLGFGFGGNYASENLILNREATGQFTLPSYTVFNASVFYDTNSYRLDLKVNNLGDETYYNGWSTINPQSPRNVTASFSYKF